MDNHYPNRVSVIIPCYNAALYLREALDSVLGQTHKCHEIIVIDDGSTDGSAAIVASYGSAVTLIRQQNQGIATTRNEGLKRVQGDLVAFLDADDYWPADSVAARLVRLMASTELEGVFGLIEAFISPELSEAQKQEITEVPAVQAGRVAGGLLVKRQAFEKVGGFNTDLQVGETMDWIARAQEHGIRFGQIPGIVLHRRIHTVNTVRKAQRLQADYLQVLHAAIRRRRALATHTEEKL
ncbi:MAG: glycosyltransferase family A protein [Methylovulum sp.]|uniref:glycosyltransferase family 2 protein n=1 Tax=Methylovulum sp. TaxID=1916980 RepID=UPI00262BA986|nr:glycosyltransferase family A protein [Methylovulum sp.]MDD2723756.1 glycosyltransferase family A protein [Methylovulum sp.]MDD5125257.1 glycosyltransferase family A protein [Methylovulum sp.]